MPARIEKVLSNTAARLQYQFDLAQSRNCAGMLATTGNG
jgi:hypothetical protein